MQASRKRPKKQKRLPTPSNECIGCGGSDRTDEWLSFNVEVSQGPRGLDRNTIWSVTATFLVDLLICPECLFSDKYLAVREIFSHREAVSGLPNYDSNCVLICRRFPYGHVKPKRRQRIRCPNCWRGGCTVHTVYEDIPSPALALWWDTVTERVPDEMESLGYGP